jgi:phage shock protein A
MNLFDRLCVLLSFPWGEELSEPEAQIDHTLAAMEKRLAEARCCAALAIAAEARLRRELDRLRCVHGRPGPEEVRHELEVQLAVLRLVVEDVRCALRTLEERIARARSRRLTLVARTTTCLARRELVGAGHETLRAEFEQLESALLRLEKGVAHEVAALDAILHGNR